MLLPPVQNSCLNLHVCTILHTETFLDTSISGNYFEQEEVVTTGFSYQHLRWHFFLDLNANLVNIVNIYKKKYP
jgi:hypothetical protein